MQASKLVSTLKAVGKTGIGAVLCAVVGAAIGATAAGLYGVLCGTLDGVIHGDLGRIASVGLYFTFCGAASGALAGGFARIIDPEGVVDLTSRSPKRSQDRNIVFLRAGALENPLIARWRFLERLAESDASTPWTRLKNPSSN